MSDNFKSTVMYKKGEIAEKIIDELIVSKGIWIPYKSIVDGGHPFDRLIARRDKKEIMIIDVKALNERKYYPDTGISIDHYSEYKDLQDKYSIRVFLFFVDGKLGEVYGGYLDELDKETQIEVRGKIVSYPLKEKNFSAVGHYIIYFPLELMKRNIKKLTEDEVQELKEYSNEGYKKDMDNRRGINEYRQMKDNNA